MDLIRSLFKKKITEPSSWQPQNTDSQESGFRLSGYSWLVILLGVVLIGGVWLRTWEQINEDYRRTIAETFQETMNLAKVFEEHVRRVVADADKDLLTLKRAYERDGLSSPVVSAYMDSPANDPLQKQFTISNEQGTVMASLLKPAMGTDVSDREHFQVHRQNDIGGLFIGRTITGRISGQALIPLSRRIDKPDGSFGGIVFVALRTGYFLDFYDKIDLGPNQLISMTGLDGFIRIRRAGDSVLGDQDLRNSEFWRKVQAGLRSETYTTGNYLDGISRIMSYRVMPDYPLIVAVAKSTQAALAGFEERKQNALARSLLISLFIVAFGGLLVNRHKKLQEKNKVLQNREAELSAANSKLAESSAAVQKEKDWLATLVNNISDEVWFTDTEKKVTFANQVALRKISSGSAQATIERLAFGLEVLRPDGSPRPADESPSLRALQGKVSKDGQEIVRSPANGEWRWREVSASPVRDTGGDIIGAVSVVRDITERKALENELERHRKNLQALVEEQTHELSGAVREIRHQTAMLNGINRILLEALICNTEEELGKKCLAVLEEVTGSKFGFIGKINADGKLDTVAISNPGWDACNMVDKTGHVRESTESEVRGLYGRVILDGTGFFSNDPASHPDSIGLPEGHPPVESFLGAPLIFEGKSVGVVVLGNRDGGYRAEDLHTAETMSYAVIQAFMHKRSQRELFLKSNEITAILGSITDSFYALDSQWRFTLINPVAALGNIRDNEELIGQNIWETFPELTDSDLYHKYHEALATKEPIHTIGKDPWAEKWLDVNIYPYLGGIFVYYKDFTDRMTYEKELARLDRLNTVGEMAAAIGHEVRNPMTTVRGYLQYYGRKAAFADYREPFDLMIEELDRANSIITEFLSLAKNKTVSLNPTNLNQVIRNLVPLVQSDALLRGSNIDVELQDIPEVPADEQEMRQCILNLVSNGLDVTPKGGRVIISTSFAGSQVIMTVRDSGPGIPPEIQDKLGTPFFSTKENGAGLGLAVCYQIAQRHNATIEIMTGDSGTAIQFIFHQKKSSA